MFLYQYSIFSVHPQDFAVLKPHPTALAYDNTSQETGKQSLQDVFSQCKRYTEKESIPGLQEESWEQRDLTRSL